MMSEADSIASGSDASGPTATLKKRKTSTVWESFTVSERDPSKAICHICDAKISRGRDPKHFNTTALHNHLSVHLIKKNPSGSDTSSASSSRSRTPSQGTGVQVGASPIVAAFAAKQPLPANHPRAKEITKLIGKMICTDLEPYSVVEKKGFKSLVAFLEPKYHVPSRHHFSRTVVPQLYESTMS